MKGSSNYNGKVSDSGYTNTCVSQSRRSSGSSLSRNSKRSESSGYCGGHPSAFDSSNYALPQPISRHKGKEHRKKKFKAATTASLNNVETKHELQNNSDEQNDLVTYDSNGSSSDSTSNGKKSEEIASVELIDDTGLGREHNGDSNSTVPEIGAGTNTSPLEDTTSNSNAGFCVVISMKKGLVIDVTPSLKNSLGYTRESWIDRSFIDFVHPKDKKTFDDHLAKSIALLYENRDKGLSGRQTGVFCNLRKNDEGRLSNVQSSSSDETNSLGTTANLAYLPFRLITSIKFFHERDIDEKPRMMFLTVNAEPIVSVYKAPEEMIISAIFSTRHNPSCILTHVDLNVVQYFGYTPQDMIGRSLFDFYHPEDLPFIKDVYETIVKMEGSPFRSKPYRFAAQNGDYVVLETEWSSFLNPWSEKLEFFVGHHRILRGPTNPNVFEPPGESQRSLLSNISEEIFKESKIIQGEIRALLDEQIQRTEDNETCEITSRSKYLDKFVANLLREVKPPLPVSKERLTTDDRSFVEHDSVILGAISSHHDYCESKSSTDTPVSYNQLNYKEKIARFFDSKFNVTATYGSDEDNINLSLPSNEDAGKTSSNLTDTKDTILSTENLSNCSKNHTSYDSRDYSNNHRTTNKMQIDHRKIPILTESVLNKHNQEMEKLLIQQHKERRFKIKNNNEHSKDSRFNDKKDRSKKHGEDRTNRRVAKRQSIDNLEGQQCKVSKYDENARRCNVAPLPAEKNTPMNVDDQSSSEALSKQNTWPSLTVGVPPQPTHPYLYMAAQNNETQEVSRCLGFSPVVPVYYLPLPRIREDLVQTIVSLVSGQSAQNSQPQHNAYVSYAAAPLPGVIYPPSLCAPAPVQTLYRPFVIPEPAPINRETSQQSNLGIVQQENSYDRIKRSVSQATSIKAEPGSTMAVSESSKKPFSLGEHFSSSVSIDGGCSSLVPDTKRETNTYSQFESSLEDSSDSSFYGSFLTTSNESDSNSKSQIVAHAPQKSLWKPTIIQHMSSDRKQLDMLRKGPPWQEGVKITKELIYQYQLTPKPLSEVLEADMRALKNFHQPQMVNDQLAQLYSDMELDASGFAAKLVLCEADASTESDDMSDSSANNNQHDIIMPEKKVRSQLNRMRRRRNHICVKNEIG